VKNIGKPCAGIGVSRDFAKQKLAKPHARFDEGGQAQACPLPYPITLLLEYRIDEHCPAAFVIANKIRYKCWIVDQVVDEKLTCLFR
jgi:hypothetical protein